MEETCRRIGGELEKTWRRIGGELEETCRRTGRDLEENSRIICGYLVGEFEETWRRGSTDEKLREEDGADATGESGARRGEGGGGKD